MQLCIAFFTAQSVEHLTGRSRVHFPGRDHTNTVPDPDLEIRRGGGGGGWSSRPLDKRGQVTPKFFFRPFEPQSGLKKGGAGPPGLLPWIPHCNTEGPKITEK